MSEDKNNYRFSLDANILFLAVIAVLITVGVFAISMSARTSALNAKISILESKDFNARMSVLEHRVGVLEDPILEEEKLMIKEKHDRLMKKGGN